MYRNTPDWPSPTDLRCVGGPADGKWFAVPPLDYWRVKTRGGAAWYYVQTVTPQYSAPRSALPGESA